MDYYHHLSPSHEAVPEETHQPTVGSYVEVRVREHPPRWIQGEPVGVWVVVVIFTCSCYVLCPSTAGRPSSDESSVRRYTKGLRVCLANRRRGGGRPGHIHQ